MLNLLFVCIENSCRSQMAEGWAKHFAKQGSSEGLTYDVYSAGSHPSGKVNPLAIEVMKEVGVDLSQHRSKGLYEVPDFIYDYVITMGCGDSCPFIVAKKRQDWKIENPGLFSSLPREQALEGFRKIRDQIREKVVKLLQEAK